MNETSPHGTVGFRVVGAMKLSSGFLMALAGLGIFRSLHSDLGASLEHYFTRLHLDPDNVIVREVLARVEAISPKQLKLIGMGTFIYAVVHFIEGSGLILLQRWAEWLTVVLTGSLMPLELYEIYRKPTPIRICVLAVNAAIVVYLIYKLRQQHQFKKATASASKPAS